MDDMTEMRSPGGGAVVYVRPDQVETMKRRGWKKAKSKAAKAEAGPATETGDEKDAKAAK